MKFLSVCSGIEAASCAWEPLGFTPVAFSEIESFPCSVLAHHFPSVPNLGDMTNFEEWNIEPGSVDILVGGTPCQSFSVAGLRGGLKDDRGNLALTYCRILQKFRPRWFVWENVPGVLSSNGGRDFGSILGAMVELGYGIAYRILDAQFFGVPQRRRRVFVVGCLGDWRRAAEVLFEPGCLCRDSSKSQKARQAVAALTANGVGTCSTDDNQGQAGHLIAHALRGEGFDASEDGTGRGTPLVASPIIGRPYGDRGAGEYRLVPSITSHYGKGDDSDCTAPLVTHSLRGEGFDASEDGTGRGTPLVAATLTSGSSSPKSHGKKNGTDRETLIPVAYQCHGTNVGEMGTLRTGNGNTTGVRRLTPTECEFLQGFPRNWTMVPYRGKPAADGPRYKAIGNSMAVPVMRWIGKRIEEQHR